jgi:hypothetical protein
LVLVELVAAQVLELVTMALIQFLQQSHQSVAAEA